MHLVGFVYIIGYDARYMQSQNAPNNIKYDIGIVRKYKRITIKNLNGWKYNIG